MPPRPIVYFPLADPNVPAEWLDIYVEAGVDVIECGWPAADPYLDGPDVRASMARAAGRNPSLALAEARARLARFSRPPKLLVMTYAEENHPAFADREAFAGADAVLAVGRAASVSRRKLEARARSLGAGVAAFLALPLQEEEIEAARTADFYVMLQAAPGVTGPRDSLDPANAERIARLRAKGVAAPIVLGFGLSNGAQARKAVEFGADGVVVGSAALRAALKGKRELAALLEDLRKGLDG